MNQQMPEILPKPWSWDSDDLSSQLQREMPENHILAKRKVKSIARRQDNDNVLFQIEGGKEKYAIVHLTWSQKKLTDKKWPTAELYNDWEDVFTNRILIDAEGWED